MTLLSLHLVLGIIFPVEGVQFTYSFLVLILQPQGPRLEWCLSFMSSQILNTQYSFKSLLGYYLDQGSVSLSHAFKNWTCFAPQPPTELILFSCLFLSGGWGGRVFCIFPLSSSPWSISIVYLDFLFCAISPISASHHCPENRNLWFCSLMFSRCLEPYHGRTWRKTQIVRW